jgi:putative transposase
VLKDAEKLKIKNMTKSATGTVEEPKKSSGKRGLNRAITQQSWGLFFEMLKYKAEKKGGEVIEVDPKFTSQKCSCCGHISKENRKSQSKFRCVKCNFRLNADLNASLNILNTVGHMEKAS